MKFICLALIFCGLCLLLKPAVCFQVHPSPAEVGHRSDNLTGPVPETAIQDEDKVKPKSTRVAITPWGPMDEDDKDGGFFSFLRKLFHFNSKKHKTSSDDDDISGDSKNCNKWGCSAGGASKCGPMGCSGRTE